MDETPGKASAPTRVPERDEGSGGPSSGLKKAPPPSFREFLWKAWNAEHTRTFRTEDPQLREVIAVYMHFGRWGAPVFLAALFSSLLLGLAWELLPPFDPEALVLRAAETAADGIASASFLTLATLFAVAILNFWKEGRGLEMERRLFAALPLAVHRGLAAGGLIFVSWLLLAPLLPPIPGMFPLTAGRPTDPRIAAEVALIAGVGMQQGTILVALAAGNAEGRSLTTPHPFLPRSLDAYHRLLLRFLLAGVLLALGSAAVDLAAILLRDSGDSSRAAIAGDLGIPLIFVAMALPLVVICVLGVRAGADAAKDEERRDAVRLERTFRTAVLLALIVGSATAILSIVFIGPGPAMVVGLGTGAGLTGSISGLGDGSCLGSLAGFVSFVGFIAWRAFNRRSAT